MCPGFIPYVTIQGGDKQLFVGGRLIFLQTLFLQEDQFRSGSS